MFTRQQEELNIKRRKEASDDIIFYEDFDGRMQIISMKQMEEVTKSPSLSRMVISQPRIRMLTRQQEQKSKRRKVTADEIILYEDLDGRTHIISMKQVEEGRTKIITTNKQKEEDIIFYEDLDGSTKINEKQNDKMDNTIKIDNKAPRSDLIIHPVNSQESGADWAEIDREIESFLCEDPDEGKKINEDQNGKMDNTIKIVNKTLEERSELIIHPVNSRESGADWSELEDITPEDLDGSTKINEEQNDKMDNTTKTINEALARDGRPKLIAHPVNSQESEVDWRELRRESLGGTAWERALRKESLGGTAWERELGRERVLQYYNTHFIW